MRSVLIYKETVNCVFKKSKSLSNSYKIHASVWIYPGNAAWHFITIQKKQSTEIKSRFGKMKRGWGSLPVTVTVGKTSWKTSIFPNSKSDAYLLPLKSEVRKKEKIRAGDTIPFSIEIAA